MPCCCTHASESPIPAILDHFLLSKRQSLNPTIAAGNKALRYPCQAGASSKAAVFIVIATCCLWSTAANTETLKVCSRSYGLDRISLSALATRNRSKCPHCAPGPPPPVRPTALGCV